MQLHHLEYANMSKAKMQEATSKRRFQSICVFGSSDLGKDSSFMHAANELGRELAARKINLIYGGGIQGLKGCVAGSAILRGSDVVGVVIKELSDRNTAGYTLGTELQVSSIPERMGYMLYNAEAFIAVPGGLGTLEEISSIASWVELNFHQKPLGLLNTNGFYDSLLLFLDQAVEQGFLTQAIRRTIISAPTVVQLIDQLENFVPEPPEKKRKRDRNNKDKDKDKGKGKEGAPDTTLRL